MTYLTTIKRIRETKIYCEGDVLYITQTGETKRGFRSSTIEIPLQQADLFTDAIQAAKEFCIDAKNGN